MPCWRTIGNGLLGLMLLALEAAGASPPVLALEKLTVGVNEPSPGMSGVFWAKEAGTFQEQGLAVEFVFFAAGTEAIQALVGERLSIMTGLGGPPLVNAVLAGAELVWIAETLGTMPYTLVVAPEIAQPSDLKGKRLAISKFGSSAEFAARFALTRMGLDPRRDVSILQVGEQSVRLAALMAKSVDGTLISAPSTVVARKAGFRELTDLSRLGLRYPHEGIAVSRALLRDRPDTLRRLVKAIVLGTHRFKTDRLGSIQIFHKYLKIDDPEALNEAYSVFSKLVPAKPYLAPEGVQLILDEIAPTNPRARQAKPQDFLDMRFVRELDESGLIDRLYR